MLPRLKAEEQLMAISAGTMASGRADKREAQRYLTRLDRSAEGGRLKAVKATPEMLAGMGIAVEIVSPASTASEVEHG